MANRNQMPEHECTAYTFLFVQCQDIRENHGCSPCAAEYNTVPVQQSTQPCAEGYSLDAQACSWQPEHWCDKPPASLGHSNECLQPSAFCLTLRVSLQRVTNKKHCRSKHSAPNLPQR